jgi:hypothetical protein
MKEAARKAVTNIAEILIVTYAAGCGLVFIPFAVVLSLGGFSFAPQTTAELKPLYYSVLAFVSIALIALVCVMIRRPGPNPGEAHVAR